MRSVRGAAVLVVVAVLAAVGFVFFSKDGTEPASSERPGGPSGGPTEAANRPGKPIGDGSTEDTGPQPNQAKPEKLKPGEKPPQFVVFSWDGAGEQVNVNLFSKFRQVAKENNATMTYFLTGIYLLPESKAPLYKPPQHAPGASAIGYLKDENIRLTIEQVRAAWLEGNEIGTHFNGHFCGAKGGGDWSSAEWKSEIEQAYSFVQNWRTNTGYTDLAPFPFDYKKELIGGRAPCLEGQKTLLPAAKEFGWRYDSSGSGGQQVWPRKKEGLWDMPLQSMPFPGRAFETLSMDYNIMCNQSNCQQNGDPAKQGQWRQEATGLFLNGFNRAYNGNRAPLIIGNHFEKWNGGIYMDAVEQTVKTVCKKPEVRCVSFRQLVDWLDVQDPAVMAKLQGLSVGATPDWASVVTAAAGPGGAAPGTPASYQGVDPAEPAVRRV